MAEKISTEQFWKLYKNLPQLLKDVLFDEETGNSIYEVCQRNDVLENLDQIVDLVGYVLLGLLPPEKFSRALKEIALLDEELSQKVAQEINRLIFFSVKESLAEIYTVGVSSTERKPFVSPEKKISEEEIFIKEEKKATSGEDFYREIIK